jgi:signal peptidase II
MPVTIDRMAETASENRAGAYTRFGLAVAGIVCALDQALKLWVIFWFDLPARGLVPVAPGFDLVMTWNTGISYGLFPQGSDGGRWLLIAVKIAAAILLTIWLTRARTRLTALALSLIIGGAIGNAIDRLAYGAVADFVLLHATFGGSRVDWYVFNLADAAIVAGVIGLLYESLIGERAAKAP